jgi:hypothetical protein
MCDKPDFVFDEVTHPGAEQEWHELCKRVHHAFQYGFHCSDMTHGEMESDISFAIDQFARKHGLPEYDWDTDYDEMYPVEDADA